jgi:hypothetical protein
MQKRLKWILLTVLALGLLSLAGHRLYRMAMSTPIPRQVKLVDCTGPVLNCTFTAPKAYGFAMLMAAPQQADLDFSGLVRISSGAEQLLEFEISSGRTRSCTWLQSQGIPSASILTDDLHPKYPGLELSPGRTYQATVSFTRSPPPGCSIWMSWLEHAGDRKPATR